jgi:hypothetical protein
MICVSNFHAIISDYPRNDGLNYLQWLAMPNNLIFMGLHFVIGKCTQRPINLIAVSIDESYFSVYANSLLVTYVYHLCQFPIFKMSENFW